MEEEISNSSLNFINPSEIELGNSIVQLSQRQTCMLYSARWNSRRYVLKSLRREFADNPVYIEALRKEFELGVRLDHPDIIRVVALEEIATLGLCIVMEWVDGEPLNKFLATHPPGRERRAIAVRLAKALAYMHSAGVSHRDLKPDNILITRRAHDVKIIDFGLGDADTFTSLKSSRGTRSYGAPELQGKPAVADSAADVYSFGKILQQLLPKRSKRRLIKRCLRIDPKERPSMEQVATSLVSNRWRNIALWLLAVGAAAGIAAVIVNQNSADRRAVASIPTDSAVRVDTVYIVQHAPGDSTAAAQTRRDDNATPESTTIVRVNDSNADLTMDSIFGVYQKKSDANFGQAKAKLVTCASIEECVNIFSEYADHTQSITNEMEQSLKEAGYTEYSIGTAINSLYIYTNRFVPELTELQQKIFNPENNNAN